MEKVKKQHHQTLAFIFLLIILLSLTNKSGSSSSELSKARKHHFVLVHGSCHGAWSWYKVITLLKSWGHSVTALDLTASGVNQKKALELKSISEYFEPLSEFMASSVGKGERVVLVGHSLGGLAISHAMEHFPHKMSVAVFVTAMMPGPTLNISTLNQKALSKLQPLLDNHYTYDEGPNKSATTFVFGPKFLASKVYQLSPDQAVIAAVGGGAATDSGGAVNDTVEEGGIDDEADPVFILSKDAIVVEESSTVKLNDELKAFLEKKVMGLRNEGTTERGLLQTKRGRQQRKKQKGFG